MSRWALVGILTVSALTALSGQAAAQGDGVPGVEPVDDLEVGVTALPGGDHIGYAESLPRGTVSTAFSAGFGYRSGLLASSHKMSRGAATAALAYSITDVVSAGLLLDGRYDKHTGTGFEDDGWVGEPRLHLRAGKAMGKLGIGGELTLWVPGKDAPSIVPKATSVDVRGLLSTRLGNGLRIALNAGYRLDNSAKSVDNAMDLSTPDQASLGVSQWSAIVGGVRAAFPTRKLVFGVEAEIHDYVGGPSMPSKPRPSLVIGASVSYRINATLTAELYLVSNIQEKPVVSAEGTIALIPYGPLFGGGLGLQARFGGPGVVIAPPTCDDPDPSKRPDDCRPPPLTTATLNGQITDDTGTPIAGAKVTVTDGDGKTVTDETGGDGRYSASELKPGQVTVVVDAPNKVSQTTKVNLKAGANDGPTTALAPVIPPGRLRFVIRSFSTGKGIDANVEVNPGGHTLRALADGSSELDIAPGTYTVKVSEPGFKEQTREYIVDVQSVVIVNVDLRK